MQTIQRLKRMKRIHNTFLVTTRKISYDRYDNLLKNELFLQKNTTSFMTSNSLLLNLPNNNGTPTMEKGCHLNMVLQSSIHRHPFKNTPRFYSTIINCRNQQKEELEEKTKQLLNLFHQPKTKSTVSLQMFHNLMNDWSDMSSSSSNDGMYAAHQSKKLLMMLQDNYDENVVSTVLIPTAVSYNKVCHAYASSGGGIKAALEAQSILESMMERCNNYHLLVASSNHNNKNKNNIIPPPPEPTEITFNTVINAWAKSNHEDAGQKAEDIFRMMEQWTLDCRQRRMNNSYPYKGVLPNARSLCGVLDAHANSNSTNDTTTIVLERVMTILTLVMERNRQAMQQSNQNNNDNKLLIIVPNRIVFHSVLHVIAKHAQTRRDAEMAESILHWMEELSQDDDFLQYCYQQQTNEDQNEEDVTFKPNTRSFSLVMDAWANIVETEGTYAATKVEALLLEMETYYHQQGELHVKPNVITYTTCLSSYAKCTNSTNKVQEIFQKLLTMYRESQDKDFCPTTTTFNTCIAHYARLPDPIQAESILDMMEQSQYPTAVPDTTTYNTVMNAYCKSDEPDKDAKVMSLFSRMEQQTGIEPDSITYNTILDTLSRVAKHDHTAADKAYQLLQKMIQLSQENETNSNIQPSNISFTSTLNCYARQHHTDLEKAKKIFHQIMDLYAKKKDSRYKPDEHLFATFINICANSSSNNKRQALREAIQAFEQFKTMFGSPNQYMYGSLIKACIKLSQTVQERGRLLESIFIEAQKNGQVSRAVWNQFINGAPIQIKHKLLSKHKKDRSNRENVTYTIPPEWYKNVRKKDQPIL